MRLAAGLLGATTAIATGIIVWVHHTQTTETERMSKGVLRDVERARRRAAALGLPPDEGDREIFDKYGVEPEPLAVAKAKMTKSTSSSPSTSE